MINIYKKIENKIKIIKLIYSSIIKKNGFLNIIDQDRIINSYKINNFNKESTLDEYLIFILEEFSVSIEFYLIILNNIKKNFIYTIKFVDLLIKYLIEKYYYGLNDVHFILKSHKNMNIPEFFIIFDKLKSALNFIGEEDKPLGRLSYLYTAVMIAIVYIFPVSWFLMRVVTDPQNWVLYFFENIKESLVL